VSVQTINRFICDLCNSHTTLNEGEAETPLLWARISEHYTEPTGHTQSLYYDVCDKCVEKIIKARTGGAK
jgi:hypothetical protein